MADLRQDDLYVEDEAPAPPRRERLRYNPRDTRGEDVFDAAERNTRRVRFLRIVLPAIVVVAVVGFWSTARFMPGDMNAIVESAGIDVQSNSVVMEAPHISGFEGTRRAYEVKAASAVQSLDDPKVVTFNDIDGRFGLDGAGQANLSAAVGIYDGNNNTLMLRGGASVETTTGYSATLQEAAIDLANGTLVSERPIEIRTQEGSLQANRVSVADRGKRVTFTGGVRVVYMPPAELVTETGRAETPSQAVQ